MRNMLATSVVSVITVTSLLFGAVVSPLWIHYLTKRRDRISAKRQHAVESLVAAYEELVIIRSDIESGKMVDYERLGHIVRRLQLFGRANVARRADDVAVWQAGYILRRNEVDERLAVSTHLAELIYEVRVDIRGELGLPVKLFDWPHVIRVVIDGS